MKKFAQIILGLLWVGCGAYLLGIPLTVIFGIIIAFSGFLILRSGLMDLSDRENS